MPTKVYLVKAVVFPRVMYGCESWTIKKAECRRIDVFELLCWRRLLRVPWTARRSNQSILKESVLDIHWKDWRWSWNSNTLATWCKELTHWKRPWCWERLGAEGEGDDRGRDGWVALLIQWTWVWASSGSWWWTERPGECSSWGSKESDTTERLNWTELNNDLKKDVTQDFCLYVCHFSCESEVKVKVGQSRLTLCDPMDYTAHGVLQARILEWVAFPFSRGIFPTQGLNPGIPHCGQILSQLSHKGGPVIFLTYCQIF